jgi:hypothetical protein
MVANWFIGSSIKAKIFSAGALIVILFFTVAMILPSFPFAIKIDGRNKKQDIVIIL